MAPNNPAWHYLQVHVTSEMRRYVQGRTLRRRPRVPCINGRHRGEAPCDAGVSAVWIFRRVHSTRFSSILGPHLPRTDHLWTNSTTITTTTAYSSVNHYHHVHTAAWYTAAQSTEAQHRTENQQRIKVAKHNLSHTQIALCNLRRLMGVQETRRREKWRSRWQSVFGRG